MTKRNRIVSSLFAALIIASAIGSLYLVRAFVAAVWGNVASIVFGAIILVLLIWWIYYEQDDEEEKEPKEVIITEDHSHSNTWVRHRGEVFDSYHIMYISRNPNDTINIHFSDGKVINTMITDYEEFCEKIIRETPIEIN